MCPSIALKVYLKISPAFGKGDKAGAYHAAVVIEYCDDEGVLTTETYEISNNPSDGFEKNEPSPRMKSVARKVGEVAGNLLVPGVGGPIGGGILEDEISKQTTGVQKTVGDSGRKWLKTWIVEDTYDYDQDYLDAVKSVKAGEYDLLTNNCFHWARKVIEKAGGQWPIKEDMNHGYNPGNPGFPGPRPAKEKEKTSGATTKPSSPSESTTQPAIQPTITAPEKKKQSFTIRQGDTVSERAQQYGGYYKRIKQWQEANPHISNLSKVRPGDIIYVPE